MWLCACVDGRDVWETGVKWMIVTRSVEYRYGRSGVGWRMEVEQEYEKNELGE